MAYRNKSLLIAMLLGGGLSVIIVLSISVYKKSLGSVDIKRIWTKYVNAIGIASPTLSDINGDSMLDIVIGTGFERPDSGYFSLSAFDGSSGKQIWSFQAPAPITGMPANIDITNDGIDDFTVTGRFNDIIMLNGQDGRKIWSMKAENPLREFLPMGFGTPVIVDDFNHDEYPEIVVIQTGLIKDSTYLTAHHIGSGLPVITIYNRSAIINNVNKLLATVSDDELSVNVCFAKQCVKQVVMREDLSNQHIDTIMKHLILNQDGPGSKMMIISSKTGKILAQYSVPFNRESWGVPIYLKINRIPMIIYGSGGDRVSGHITAQNLLTGQPVWVVESKEKGFLSSPILVRNHQQLPLVYAATMDGTVIAINALTGKTQWRVNIGAEYQGQSSLAARNRHGSMSIIGVFTRGKNAKYDKSIMVELDAHTGEKLNERILGFCHSASSPIIADIDDNGSDDIVVLSCSDSNARLLAIDADFKIIFEQRLESASYATPLIDDIDQNNQLDIILPRFHFLDRYEQQHKMMSLKKLQWNRHRGYQQNGHFN